MAMTVNRPSSTPTNEADPYGLEQLHAFNRNGPSRSRMTGPDGGLYLRSMEPGAASSRMQQSMHTNSLDPFVGHQHDQKGYGNMQSPGGLGVRFDAYSQHDHEQYSTPQYTYDEPPPLDTKEESSSPLTPQTPSSDFGKRTRTNRIVGRDTYPQVLRSNTTGNKVAKSPRVRPSRSKSTNTKAPKIHEPLSELTKNMEIPVRDMEAWVNRPVVDRNKEMEKRNGYIARPMNSFMLYRSAYAERTKAWCVQNNHQVVSAVSGESWPLEPESIRQFYNELSKTERDNHAKAHPDYKFSPSKTGPAARKKKEDFSEEEEDSAASDAGDGDGEWRPKGDRRRRQTREDFSASPFQNSFDHQFHGQNGFSPQPWDLQQEQRFPTLASSPGPYGMPYYQHAHQQQYVMPAQHDFSDMQILQHPAYSDMYSRGLPSGLPSSFGNEFQHMHAQQMHDTMDHGHFEPHDHFGVKQENGHAAQVDPTLLALHGDPQAHSHEKAHRDQFMGHPFSPNEFDHEIGWFGQDQHLH